MRIAIIADPAIPVPPIHYGGIERIIDMLIKGLQEKGHEVTLLAHRDSKVDCQLISYPGKSQHKLDVLQNTWKVSNLLQQKYDIIHNFGRLAYITALLPTRIPKIMSYQREPTISQVKKAVMLAQKNTLWFTGCSEYIASQIRPFAPSVSIANGVPLSTYIFQPEVNPDAPLVFLGRIEYIKGAHVAIEVARKSGRKLIIAGNIPADATAQEYFQAKIRPFIDENYVQYIGPVNDAQKSEFLGKAYAFLMPILWNEPFGIVMTEALACGTPVIGFRRGALPEVVQTGVNGYCCESIDEMALAVQQVQKISRRNCRSIAEKQFSENVVTDQYESLYKSILNQPLEKGSTYHNRTTLN